MKKPDFDTYGCFLFHQKRLIQESMEEYEPALYQIKHMMELHPKDIKWIVQVTLDPHLSEQRLAELARQFLRVNVEYRILGHHKDIYGNNLLSCIVRKFSDERNNSYARNSCRPSLQTLQRTVLHCDD